MKRTILLFAALLFVFAGYAQEDGPAPSPAGTVSQKVGLTDITIEYSRPGIKDRDMYEALTPVGKIWRTGANSGTKFTFSTDVMIDGSNVPAGEYLIFSIPGKDEWSVMLYKDTSLGGYVSKYDEANELARWTVKPMEMPMSIETMTFGISNVKDTSASIVFMWGNTSWMMNVEVPKTW